MSRRIKVLILAPPFVHPVKAPDYMAVDEIDHGFGDCLLGAPGLEAVNALLHDDLGDRLAAFGG